MPEKLIGDCGVTIISGQIVKRITANEEMDEESVETRKVVVPKSIHEDGTVDITEMPEESLKVAADPKRLTESGDIVIKLSTPFDAGIITEECAGCLVPSFCAIIKECGELDVNYLLAFLNSARCKTQLKAHVAGMTMTVISVGKISKLKIPVVSEAAQKEIGLRFLATQHKLQLIRQIEALEAKRNSILFDQLEENNG